jgi:murein DD-endopeptidase MepM/ murein hydrolase activator NlpD
MHIAKVALAFFSVGFLAGSFERAAGLGYDDRGRVEQQQLALADALIVRSTGALQKTWAAATALPEELAPRPLSSEPNVPDDVVAALSELAREEAGKADPVVHSPEPTPHSDSVDPGTPNVRRPRLGMPRIRSEIDGTPLSHVPPPLSVRPAGPLPDDPIFRLERGDRDLAVVDGPEFIMPFERGRVTSLFHDRRYHPAIDLAGPLGTPVHATTRAQRVIFTGWRNGYGYTVVTRDDAGRMHLYGHLQRVLTKPGIVLDQGKVLGLLGSTGRSTGPHVHYEVKTRIGAHVNPAGLLFPGRRVARGLAWNGSRSMTRVASRHDRDQPRPR